MSRDTRQIKDAKKKNMILSELLEEAYRIWTSNGIGILNNNGMTTDAVLWIKDIDILPAAENTEDYINALSKSIASMEIILDRLRFGVKNEL